MPESSRPRITAIDRNEGVPRIRFTTRSGQTYRLEYKNSIVNAEWAPVAGAETISGTGGEVEVSDRDPASPAASRRFYRVQMQLPPPPPTSAPLPVPTIEAATMRFDADRGLSGHRENSLRLRAASNSDR
jgi:hypothetical protein